ncbi:MAG: DUF2384 domain-containing protein [Shewanella sp.]|nr:DUF2384 domain-containing protein [Shewanella sp.]
MNNLLLQNVGIESVIFSNPQKMFELAHGGVAGDVVRKTVKEFPKQREAICKALSVTSGNLSRLYSRKHLSRPQSEEILDILAVYSIGIEIYEDLKLVEEFFGTSIPALNNQTPESLLSSFTGRKMVKDVLNKILWMEFS